MRTAPQEKEGRLRGPLVSYGGYAAGLCGACRKQGRKPALARKRRLRRFGHRPLLHAGDVLRGLLGRTIAHGLNDTLLAGSTEVAGGGRLPVGRHIQPHFTGENGSEGF